MAVNLNWPFIKPVIAGLVSWGEAATWLYLASCVRAKEGTSNKKVSTERKNNPFGREMKYVFMIIEFRKRENRV